MSVGLRIDTSDTLYKRVVADERGLEENALVFRVPGADSLLGSLRVDGEALNLLRSPTIALVAGFLSPLVLW